MALSALFAASAAAAQSRGAPSPVASSPPPTDFGSDVLRPINFINTAPPGMHAGSLLRNADSNKVQPLFNFFPSGGSTGFDHGLVPDPPKKSNRGIYMFAGVVFASAVALIWVKSRM